MKGNGRAMSRAITLLFLLLAVSARAQDIDSTGVENIRELEAKIDSLGKTVRLLERALQSSRNGTGGEEEPLDELLAVLNEEEVERADLERRSKRNRVEELLEAITKRPGRLSFNGGSTTILQRGAIGGCSHTYGAGSFDIYAHTAFGPNSLIFLDLEAVGGNGPDDCFPTFTSLNDDAGSTQDDDGIDRVTVLEAWTEFTMLDKHCTITAGKIDLTNYFDNNASANDETTQFITSAFVNSAAFSVPDNSPGARFRTTLADRFHFQFAFSSADNSGEDLLKNIYKIGSIGFTVLPDSEFESNLRVYGYQHPMAEDGFGWGLSFDNVSFGAFNIFARYGRNENEVAEYWGVESAWSAGTRWVKNLAGNTTVLALAVGENLPCSDTPKDEKVMEIYARRRINKWVSLSPHIQMIWNAGGTSEKYTIFGVRTHFNF